MFIIIIKKTHQKKTYKRLHEKKMKTLGPFGNYF